MNALGVKKPLILGEWGTPHTTRPAPDFYGTPCIPPIKNLDNVPQSDMGPGKPYYAAEPVATYLNTEWNTIKANIAAKVDQVCVGGFIFDWSDEYWKGNNPSVQQGGPEPKFLGEFAGGYADEAGYGVTSSVSQDLYGGGNPKTRNQCQSFVSLANALSLRGCAPPGVSRSTLKISVKTDRGDRNRVHE
jgi:hypothetical protein